MILKVAYKEGIEPEKPKPPTKEEMFEKWRAALVHKWRVRDRKAAMKARGIKHLPANYDQIIREIKAKRKWNISTLSQRKPPATTHPAL